MFNSEEIKERGLGKKSENKKFFERIKRKKPKNLDEKMNELHQEEFEKTDCLSCANCCKTTSPIFRDVDISRISKHLGIKEIDFIESNLYKDNEGDYVLKKSPCLFLDENNYCKIYEYKPLACREYPHTNRKKFIQILNLTLKNTEICPATFNIIENLKKVENQLK